MRLEALDKIDWTACALLAMRLLVFNFVIQYVRG